MTPSVREGSSNCLRLADRGTQRDDPAQTRFGHTAGPGLEAAPELGSGHHTWSSEEAGNQCRRNLVDVDA